VTIDLLTGGPLRGLDHAVHRFTAHDVQGAWKQAADLVRLLGQRWMLLQLLVPLAVVAAVRARSLRPPVVTGLIVVGLSEFEVLAKSIIPRTFPSSGRDVLHTGGHAYPSGHTLNGFLLVWTALELAVIAFRGLAASGRLTARRRLVVAPVTGVVTGVALTLAGVHWLTDVLASLGLGIILLELLVVADPFRTRAAERAAPLAIRAGGHRSMILLDLWRRH
jgi:membrane-associated phospholipid phosphatase